MQHWGTAPPIGTSRSMLKTFCRLVLQNLRLFKTDLKPPTAVCFIRIIKI